MSGSEAAQEESGPPAVRRRSLGIAVVGFVVLAAAILIAAAVVARRLGGRAEWGVTFSQKESTAFGLDWRANYQAIVRDLHPSGLRLVAYWDLVEPRRGQYDFRDLDWQLAEAQKARIPVILAVGEKVPRYPEYYLPAWLHGKHDTKERNRRLLGYLGKLAEHYRGNKTLVYWQVENEPFVKFGNAPPPNADLLAREVDLVRRTDPGHRILMTDGGEWGDWNRAAALGDAFGTTLYRRVYSKAIGSFTPSRTPDYYAQKERTAKQALGRPNEPFMCIELQAEPWGNTLNPLMTIAQQERFFPLSQFDENVAFARQTGLKTFYLWGAEWWYFLKVHGNPAYWERARALIRQG